MLNYMFLMIKPLFFQAAQFHLSTLEKPIMASTGASSSTRKNQSEMVDKNGSIGKNCPDYRKPFARLTDNVPPPPSRDSAIPPQPSTRNCRVPPPPSSRYSKSPPPPSLRYSRKPLIPPCRDTRISTEKPSDTRKKPSHEVVKNDSIGKVCLGYKQLVTRPTDNAPPPPSRDFAIPLPPSIRDCRVPPPPPSRDSRKPLPPPSRDTRILTESSSDTKKKLSHEITKNYSIGNTYKQLVTRPTDNVPPLLNRDFAIPHPPHRDSRNHPPPPPRDSRIPPPLFSQDSGIPPPPSSRESKTHEADKNDLIGKNCADYTQPRPDEIPPPPSYPRPVPSATSAPNQPVQNPHLNPILPSLPRNVRVVAEQRSGQTDNISSPPVVPPPSTQAQFYIFVPPTPVCNRPGEKFRNPGICPQEGFFEPGMVPPGYPTLIYALPPNHDSNDFSTGAMQRIAKETLKSSKRIQNDKHNELSDWKQWKSRYSNNSRPFSKGSTRYSENPLQERFSNYRRDKVARYEPYSRQPVSHHRSPNTSHHSHQHRKNESYTENTPVSRNVSEFRNIADKDVLGKRGEEKQKEGDSKTSYIYSIDIEKIFTKGLDNQYRFENLNLAPLPNEEEEENRMEVLKFFVYHLLKQKKRWFQKGEEGSKNGRDDYIYLDGSRSLKVKGANFRWKRGNHEVSLPRHKFTETQRQSLKSVLKQDFQSVEIKCVITKTKVPQKEQTAYLEKLFINKNAEKISISHCLRAK
ncbi:unnamed protein product [Caenorhabditis brenneri]